MGETSPATKAESPVEQPSAAARLIITLGPDTGVEVGVQVPPSHAVTLVTTIRQLVALALGVMLPVVTIGAAVAGGFPAGWTVVLVLIEVTFALVALIVMRHRR